MRRFVLIIMSMFFASFVNAQVPGFMGKKLALGYNLDVGFPFFRSGDWRGDFEVTTNYKGEDVSFFALYPRQNISAEYVIGKQISIEGSIGFSKSGLISYENENDRLRDEYPGISSAFDDDPYNSPQSYDYLRVNNTMYRIGVNIFSGHYVAPHGNYWNFSYIYNKGIVQYVLNDKANDLAAVSNHGIMVTKGYRRIILSSFILDVGFGFGWAFGSESILESEVGGSYGGYYSSEPVPITKMQTVALNNSLLLNGHIGLKYLIPTFR